MKPTTFILAVLAVLVGAAAAEPVRIGVDADGHGWLFGDDEGECWVAAPLHVIGDKATGTAEPFVFYTDDQSEGGAAEALPVSAFPDALAATGGQEDLAFARVTYGPERCLSGLGLPPYVYRRWLDRGDVIRFVSMLPTSRGFFEAVPTRVRADEGAGLVLRARPRRDEDRAFLVPGLSGAVGTVQDTFGNPAPFAMALSVAPDQETVTALRFDAIAAAFDAVRGASRGTASVPQTAAFSVVSLIGRSMTDDSGPANLMDESGCFRAEPIGGERNVRIVLGVADDAVSAVRLTGVGGCGEGTTWIAEYRTKTSGNWRGGVACVATPEPSACRLGRSGVAQIRLTAGTPGDAALRSVRLE